MKNTLLTLLIISCISCGEAREESERNKETAGDLPNIVLLIGDDQGYPYFGFMGAEYVKTPNMDKLAESGTLFTNGYVPENHCRPSLATLLTGVTPAQYQRRSAEHKAALMLEEEYLSLDEAGREKWERDFPFTAMKYFYTLPKLLAEKGYASFQGGKWWEQHYENGGFTHGMSTGWDLDRKKENNWFHEFMGGRGNDLARVSNDAAYDFLEETTGQPFFMWYAPQLPHYPFDAPDKYTDIYKDKKMSRSAKLYYANCTWFDDMFGQLVAHLQEKELFENTLFVYVNDNGWEQNPDQEFIDDEMRFHNGGDKGKLSMYDQSFHTPVIFSWNGKVDAGVRNQQLMHSADIPATILDLIGMEVPDDYFGKSYKSLIEGQRASLRTEIKGQIRKIRWDGDMMGRDLDGLWMRKDNWFFSWNRTDDVKELYDLSVDPFCDINSANNHLILVEKFTAQLDDWEKSAL